VLRLSDAPFDAKRERRGDAIRALRQVAFELGVGEPHFVFVCLSRPEAGARRFPDDGVRHVEISRESADLALEQVADRQDVRGAVAVLREVADDQLAAVRRAGHEVIQGVRNEIEARHAQAGLEVGYRRARRDPRRVRHVHGPVLGRKPGDLVHEIGGKLIMDGLEIDANRRNGEMAGHSTRIPLVARAAVAGKDQSDDAPGCRQLAEPCHDRRVDPAAQADDQALRTCRRHALAQPGGDLSRTYVHKGGL
jgi:hypothetical protein